MGNSLIKIACAIYDTKRNEKICAFGPFIYLCTEMKILGRFWYFNDQYNDKRSKCVKKYFKCTGIPVLFMEFPESLLFHLVMKFTYRTLAKMYEP